MQYFAYGPELSPAKMAEHRLPYSALRPGVLTGYRLAFNREGGWANIIPAPGCRVEGAVYTMESRSLSALDAVEMSRGVCRRETVQVCCGEESIECIVYLALPEYSAAAPLPARACMQELLAGAAILTPEYQTMLEMWPLAEENLTGLEAVIFDWGDTLMRDFKNYSGPMARWPQVEIVPGVAETLAALKNKYLLAVASNAGESDASLLAEALERVGIRHCFDKIYTSRELGSNKPCPAFFIALVGKLGLRPGQCAMVGNDLEKDVLAALDTGLKAVLYAPGGSDYPRTIAHMIDLPELLCKGADN